MLCDVCSRREARAVIAMVVNGKKTTRRVCGHCIAQLQRGDAFAAQMALLSIRDDIPQDQVCPVCGTSAADLVRSGRVGCSSCYKAFNDILSSLTAQMNGTPLPSEAASEEGSETVPAPVNAADDKLAALREEMFAAVNAEEYERAAQLRDEIRLLEKGRGEESE